MRASHALSALVASIVVLGGCTSLFVGASSEDPSLTSASLTKACPLGVHATRIHIADSVDGVDVFFSTMPSHVDDLRRRVLDQSHANGPNRHLGAGHGGQHGQAHDHGLRLWSMGELRSEVTNTPSGAKLALAPADPSRRDDLRKRVIERIAFLESQGCHD